MPDPGASGFAIRGVPSPEDKPVAVIYMQREFVNVRAT
jgi:hypothetical protein